MTLLYRRLDVHLMPFFLEYLPAHKGVSTNTVQSYRDAWTLLLRFGIDCKAMGKPDDWRVNQVDRTFVLEFLTHLEEERKVCERTRNLRLAAIHSFFRYLKGVEPDLEKHCERILAIPSKKATHKLVGYLDPEELLGMFKAVRLETPTGTPSKVGMDPGQKRLDARASIRLSRWKEHQR